MLFKKNTNTEPDATSLAKRARLRTLRLVENCPRKVLKLTEKSRDAKWKKVLAEIRSTGR